jgi:hypothetical protein
MTDYTTGHDPGDECAHCAEAAQWVEALAERRKALDQQPAPAPAVDTCVYLNGEPYELGGSPVVTDEATARRFVMQRNSSEYYRGFGLWGYGRVS